MFKNQWTVEVDDAWVHRIKVLASSQFQKIMNNIFKNWTWTVGETAQTSLFTYEEFLLNCVQLEIVWCTAW